MISVTPINAHFSHTNQDTDEQGRLLVDMKENSGDYLAHPDSEIRSLADWTMEAYGFRRVRLGLTWTHVERQRNLTRLYKRLRVVAVA